MKKFLLIAFLFAVGADAQAKTSLAAIRINNLDEALQEAAGLMQMIGVPIPVNQATLPLAQFTMSGNMAGIDTASPITIYTGADAASAGGMPSIALSFTVTGDGSDYLAAVEAQLPNHEQMSESLHKFPMGPPGVDSGMAFYVVLKDGKALAGYSVRDIQDLVRSVDKDGAAMLEAFPGNISIWANVPEIDKKLSDQIQKYQDMMAQLEEMGVETETQPADVDMGGMLDSYNKMLHEILSQLQTLVVNVDLKDRLSLRVFAKPKAGSDIAALVDEMQPVGEPFSTMDFPGALMGGFGTMAGMDKLLGIYGDWIGDLYKSMGPPMDAFGDKYAEMVQAMQGLYAGGYNFYLLSPSSESFLQMAGVYAINDAEKTKASMDLMMELQTEQLKAMAAGDDPVSTADPVETEYKGLQVTTYEMAMAMDPEMAKDMPPGYGDMFSSMTYHSALTDTYQFYALGSMGNLDAAIDHINNGGGTSIVQGFPDIAEAPVSYWYLDVPATVDAFMGAMKIPGTENINLAGVSGVLRGLGIKEHGGVSSIIRLNASDIQGLMAMGMQLSTIGANARPPQQPVPADGGLPEEFRMPGE